MLIVKNPAPKGVQMVANSSANKVANWITDNATGETWCWPASELTHEDFAAQLGVTEYTKGTTTID
jgi:hypothetical protein